MSEKENNNSYKPEWAPQENSDGFAVKIVKAGDHKASAPRHSFKPKKLTTDELADGVLQNNRTILGKAITLIESSSPKHRPEALELLNRLLPRSGNSLRIGITGVPGAGKSTLIESLGFMLAESGHKVAVLAVDPSSSHSKGSILGDKTRMEKLASHPNCFIRPSPSGGTLGGVTKKTRETIIICEAAGYDITLIETVGVGQSEFAVRSMVDFFLLVLIAGAGDELQGIKKGIMEIADCVVINKADGDNMKRARVAMAETRNALHYIYRENTFWNPPVHLTSAISGSGVQELWQIANDYKKSAHESGYFDNARKKQNEEWVKFLLNDMLTDHFYGNPEIKKMYDSLKPGIFEGKILPTEAAEKLFGFYTGMLNDSR